MAPRRPATPRRPVKRTGAGRRAVKGATRPTSAAAAVGVREPSRRLWQQIEKHVRRIAKSQRKVMKSIDALLAGGAADAQYVKDTLVRCIESVGSMEQWQAIDAFVARVHLDELRGRAQGVLEEALQIVVARLGLARSEEITALNRQLASVIKSLNTQR
jgi:hypothetical protein